MTPDDQLLFACIRPDFSDAQREEVMTLCRTQTIQWESVYTTAELHAVAPLVYSNLQQCPLSALKIPWHVLDQFERDYYFNQIVKEKIATSVQTVLAYLNQKSIAVMLVKGAALDLFAYMQPWYTTANDVDLILRPTRAEMQDRAVSHYLNAIHDIHFEYDYFEHHDLTMNGVLPVDFNRVWGDATKTKWRGEDVWIMSPQDLLIAACINSCRKRYFRLKSLRDICEIVNHAQALDWDRVAAQARAYQCNAIVYAALVVAEKFVGLKLAPQTLDKLAVPKVRQNLIHYLSDRMSFTSLSNLYAGSAVFGREVGRGLLLPYATHTPVQLWKRLRFATDARTRSNSKKQK